MATPVRVKIVEARGILAADSNGFSDPYVTMTLLSSRMQPLAQGGTFKTKVIKKTLTPQWDEEFVIGERFDLREATWLRLVVADSDGFFSKDDPLGFVDIPVSLLTDDQLATAPLDSWYRLMKMDGMKKDATGEIHVILESAAPPPAAASATAAAAGASAPVSASSEPPNLLYVTIKSGKDLVAMDSGGTSDPLVKLTLNGKKHETTRKDKTLRPQWNEKFGFLVTDINTSLSLVVEDFDVTINDFMGQAKVDVSKLEPNVEKTMTVELLDKKFRKDKTERGTLTLSLLWTYDASAQDIANKKKDTSVFGRMKQALNVGVPDADYDSNEDDGVEVEVNDKAKKSEEELKAEKEEQEKKRQETLAELSSFEIKSGDYVIQVHVIEARDLVPKDATGTSDPVVYVEVLSELQQTAVKKQVLNCVWDDLLIFSPRNLDKAEVEMGVIKLSVMDANTFQRAELIGSAKFDLSYIYSQKNHQLANVWIGLIDDVNTKNEGVQGYLRASITVIGPGDKLVPPPSPFGPENSGMDGNVIMPSSISQSVKFVVATFYKAEELPAMDINVIGKGGLDAYITASVAGGDPIRTRVRSKKGARHDLCPSFNEELMLVIREPSMADKLSIGVYDWDQVGQDEIVGHISQSIKMIKAMGGRMGPFWATIYGAPLKLNKVSIGDSVKKQMNQFPDLATTYRGRVLMSLRIMDNDGDEFDEVNQKRNVKKLPRELYPKTTSYRMRAHFVWGSEIPQFSSPKHLGQNAKMQLVLTCGLKEIASLRSKNLKGLVEWNTMEESDNMLLPEDLTQVPDFFLYLCRGDGDSRRAVCYRRFTAKELFDKGFSSEAEWITLKEDPCVDALADDVFPGNVLVRLGFGLQADSEASPWDQADLDLVNKRVPYQVRVHVYQGRRLPPADSNGLLDPFLIVRCMGEKPEKTDKKFKTRDPLWYQTLYFNVNLPELRFAPQVLLRVMDHDDFDADDYVGMVSLNLSDAHVRTSDDLAAGRHATLPNPKWYPLMFQEPGDCEGELLASIELIRKKFPDETVPASASIVPETKKAFLELTVLGLRNLEPFQFLPIQLPFVEFILGGKDHASQEMITEKSKRPSGSNPNFLQRIVKPVDLPLNAHFAPRLNIIVRDTRLGGFQTPIIGSASIEMTTKIPWSPTYRPPQSDGFAEIEIEAEQQDGEEAPLLGAGGDPFLDTDNGAGVFGALKSMGVDFDIQDAAAFNDAASSRHSTGEEEQEDTKKYLKHRQLLDTELENELKTTPFEKYALHIGQNQKKTSLMAMLNPFSKKAPRDVGGGGVYKTAGFFKGLVRIMEREDEKPLLDVDRLLKPLPYEVRVYVLDGAGFAPMDPGLNGRPGKSDPYLKLTLGKEKVDDRKNYIDDTTDPDFYKMFQLSATLPGASILKIDAYDFDLIGGDDLIGSTIIDLEDRVFDQRWQDLGKLYETSNRLRLKPLETRTLTIPTSKAPMGSIKLWIDIITPAQSHDYPPIDISLPPPVEFELRVVVWKARNVPSFDEAEDMNDLFFRCWLEGSDYQETDIHWRAKKGKGSFNWRMKFPVVLGHKQPNTKFPYFHVQGWDKDVFSANDAIGENMMDLSPYFQKAYKLKAAMQFFEDDEATKKKKKKDTSDDDAAVKKIKEATGLWDDEDPPDCKWLKLERVDHKTQKREYMGEVCVSMELVPAEKAKQQAVGQGRQSPNHSPYLPPPAGRLSFSLNPFKVFNDLLGPSICNRILCCLCCVAFMVIIYFLAPFINLAIVTFK
ncbi:hypothetical protein P43SY_006836 [Pythium insidiosum]|uniref:C2 domain-containing protein n=1 Tax=Pythium insidiosum TaxID=114742 RepID=A0AAD5LWJ1_PYTIN|nr:hypothetical protein P43SY_006836 [Pythium insidiosum]